MNQKSSVIQILKSVQRVLTSDMKISMDGRGRYLDNIFIERLWRPLKQEAVYLHELTDGFVAERVIREWIKFYNTDRPHTAPFILTLEPPANWGRFMITKPDTP